MITLTYILLHIIIVLLFFLGGIYLDNSKRQDYWPVSMILCLVYSLEEGFRWGRGIDWCAYYCDYWNGSLDKFEMLFFEWWNLFRELSVPFPILMCICSALFCFSLQFLLRPYKGVYKYLLPLAIAYSSISAENLIRWYVGLSLVLISFRYFLDKKYIRFVLFALLVPLFHSGATIMIFMLVIPSMIPFNLKPKYAIAISLFLVFLFNAEFMLYFTNVATLLFSTSEKFAGYSNNIEDWLTGEGQNATLEKKSALKYVISMLPFYIMIFCGYYALKKNAFRKNIGAIYRISICGIFLISISSGLELIERFVDLFYPFLSILLSVSIVSMWWHYKRYAKRISLFCLVLLYMFLGYKYWVFIRPLDKEFKMCYVWNSNTSPTIIFDNYKR